MYQQLIGNSLAFFSKCLYKLRHYNSTTYLKSELFRRRPRLVEALYYDRLTRLIRVLQRIDVIRDLLEARNYISRVYNWYMTLHEYIKPEEEAKKALKAQKDFEALERAKQFPCSDSPPRYQEHQGRSSV